MVYVLLLKNVYKYKYRKVILKKVEEFVATLDRHEIFIMSAALAYTTALALAPFILIILSFLSFLDNEVQIRFTLELTNIFGGQVGEAVNSIIENVDSHPKLSGLSGLVGFVILIISASAIFTQLQIALDKINEYEVPKNVSGLRLYLKNKFLSLGLVLGFAFLSIASLLVTAFISLVFPKSEELFWHIISYAINFFLFTFLFSCIYRFIPSDKLNWKRCFFSGAVSTVFYLVGKALIGLYLGKAGLGSPYGAAGSLIVFLVWVYYTSLTLLLSYEISTNVLLVKKSNPRYVTAN